MDTYYERSIIRIFNGYEVRIEISVTRVTVRHHELAYSSFDNCI